MSTIKFDIQRFGSGSAEWSAGITESAIKEAYTNFCNQITKTQEAISDTAKVHAALEEGWSGQDRVDYLAKFDQHAAHVNEQIEAYKLAVGKEVASIISQWTEFQSNLISK